MIRGRCFLMAALAVGVGFVATRAFTQGVPGGFVPLELVVDGTAREALVFAPASAKTKAAPLVFVFHGHGGSARNVARSFGIQQQWPEAITVCMQGLNTPGQLTDPDGKKAGWQRKAGDMGDRDLKFFDAALAKLKQDYQVDERRVYATGHSNGGGFTYLLWAERGDVFAAVAPSGAAAGESIPKLKPKPALHIAGSADPLVKFEWQRLMMEGVKRVNGCEKEGKPWEEVCTQYASSQGASFVSFVHPGGHGFPGAAPALIVKFFKEHAK